MNECQLWSVVRIKPATGGCSASAGDATVWKADLSGGGHRKTTRGRSMSQRSSTKMPPTSRSQQIARRGSLRRALQCLDLCCLLHPIPTRPSASLPDLSSSVCRLF